MSVPTHGGTIHDLAIFVIGRGQRVLTAYEWHNIEMANGNGHVERKTTEASVCAATAAAVSVKGGNSNDHPVYLPKRARMKRPPR